MSPEPRRRAPRRRTVFAALVVAAVTGSAAGTLLAQLAALVL